jgi:hypothetical protein
VSHHARTTCAAFDENTHVPGALVKHSPKKKALPPVILVGNTTGPKKLSSICPTGHRRNIDVHVLMPRRCAVWRWSSTKIRASRKFQASVQHVRYILCIYNAFFGKQIYSHNRPWRPVDLKTLRIPGCLDSRLTEGGNIVSLTHRPLSASQKNYFSAYGTHFITRQGPIRLGGVDKLKTFIHVIGSRTRDLPARSMVP